MNNSNPRLIADKLNSIAKCSFKPPLSINELENFEKNNGIRFSDELRDWLLFSDGGALLSFGGATIFGVAHKPYIHVHFEDGSLSEYLVIGCLSYGDPILMRKNSSEICIYNQERNTIEENERFANFFEFLNSLPSIVGLSEV